MGEPHQSLDAHLWFLLLILPLKKLLLLLSWFSSRANEGDEGEWISC